MVVGMAQTSVDPREVERFARMAANWWDPRGPMAPLHKLNPVRVGYIRDQACARFGREAKHLGCLNGLRILDIGCGAGILSEPLARLGADMIGIDPAAENIEAARLHAAESGVAVDYRATTAETLAEAGERFDIVLAMEVVEHVVDVPAFVATCAAMVKPGGLLVMATLNRTMKSFALAIVGAEYLARLVPRGTHEYERLLKPSEVARFARAAGLQVSDIAGLRYDPLREQCSLTRDPSVNYLMHMTRGTAPEPQHE